MQIENLLEGDKEGAMLGLALSYYDNSKPIGDWWDAERQRKTLVISNRLAHKGDGHNKFLRACTVELLIRAPRYWWSEFDTYKVGTATQSESTMHTLDKRPPQIDDFCGYTSPDAYYAFANKWHQYDADRKAGRKVCLDELKAALPEGFLQRRHVATNYQTLQTIATQRSHHRLAVWRVFLDELREKLLYPQWVFKA